MLTEDIRILAGLQESRKIENPLPKFLKDEEFKLKQINDRKLNEKKNVVSNFNLLCEIMQSHLDLFQMLIELFSEEMKNKTLVLLTENQLLTLRKFGDILLNEGGDKGILFAMSNKDSLMKEYTDLRKKSEIRQRDNSIEYFNVTDIISESGINFSLYKDKLKTKIYGTSIPPNSKICEHSDGNYEIVISGIRYYSTITQNTMQTIKERYILL